MKQLQELLNEMHNYEDFESLEKVYREIILCARQ